MRKRLIRTLALERSCRLVVAGVASAYKPAVIKVGNLVLTFNGGFTPTKLPKTQADADQPQRLGQDRNHGRHRIRRR